MTRRLSVLLSLPVLFILLIATGSSPALSRPLADNPFSPSWDPACYLTNEQTLSFLQNIAATYPQITTLTNIGSSWEGTRPLWLMQMTSPNRPLPKPALYFVAAQHPRDIAGPATLLRFIDYLARNYGIDPDVTWLLDNKSLTFLPIANPDGYHQVYTNGLNAYKNRNNNYCTNSVNRGADINRNFPFHWNEGGTSNLPCDLSYPGPSALSEPETQHILSALGEVDADLVINLQAPGPSILYPWGYSSSPPPDAAGLDALAWNLGRLNGTPRSSVRTHNANGLISGILDDTAYGEYGTPAFTLNLGASVDPICTDLDTIWAAQLPAFLYASKAVGLTSATTLTRPFGPTPSNLAVSPLLSPGAVQLTGVISANYGTVTGAVYTIDEPGEDGIGTPMSGNFGGGIANVSATVDTSSLPNGRHMFLVQGKNNADQWGVLSSIFFTVTGNTITPSPTSLPNLTPTVTPSPTFTRTPTNTRTATSTLTPTISPTITTTPLSGTATNTPTRTLTPTITNTPTNTATRTLTPTRTQTSTRTPTITRTHTSTPTETPTRTNTPDPSSTRTLTPTRTWTPVPPTNTPRPPNTPTPLPCITFTDVYPNQFFYRAVDWLVCQGIVSGYPDNTFRPFNPTTRAQIIKMVVLGEGWPLQTPPTPTFSDVTSTDWFYEVIETAFAHGIIGGYSDNTFRPNNHVTRGQLSKIIIGARAWPLLDPETPNFIDVAPGSTFYTFIETARAHNIVGGYGDGTFRPSAEATRGQLSKMLHEALIQPGGP